MKKFYAFAAAVIATLSMNAQLYMVGDGSVNGVATGWVASAPVAFELVDGNYVLDVTNLNSFKISTVIGDAADGNDGWNTFNNASLYANVSAEDVENAVAVELESMEGVDNPGNIVTPWAGDYHVVVSGDYKTITLTTTTPRPTGPDRLFLNGGMSGWAAVEEYELTNIGEGLYSLYCTIEMGTEFKISGETWAVYDYGYGDAVYDGSDDVWYKGGGNTTMGEDFTGTVTVELTINETENYATVRFEGDASVADVAVDNAAAEYFNLQGVRVANPENGLYIVRKGGKVSKQLVK